MEWGYVMAKFTPEDLKRIREIYCCPDFEFVHERLAQLLADERERCARDAETWPASWRTGLDIALRIRGLK